MPRKKIEIDLAQVEACAARGLSMEKIALAMGISPRTLTNRKTENALVAEAIKRGRGIAPLLFLVFTVDDEIGHSLQGE